MSGKDNERMGAFTKPRKLEVYRLSDLMDIQKSESNYVVFKESSLGYLSLCDLNYQPHFSTEEQLVNYINNVRRRIAKILEVIQYNIPESKFKNIKISSGKILYKNHTLNVEQIKHATEVKDFIGFILMD